jgi:ABC-type multidrug transport system fused ATPase/permease subunit
MSERAPPELSARALIGRVARVYMAPRWKGWLTAFFAAILVAFFSSKLIQILEPATNDLMVNHKPGALLLLPPLIAAYAIGRTLAQVIQASLVNRIGNAVVGDVQVQLFGKLVRADLARLRSQHSGAYVSSVLYDAGLIREAATAGVINYTQHLLTVIGAITIMVSNDLMLSLAVVVAAPGASLIMRRFSKRPRKAALIATAFRLPPPMATVSRSADCGSGRPAMRSLVPPWTSWPAASNAWPPISPTAPRSISSVSSLSVRKPSRWSGASQATSPIPTKAASARLASSRTVT